MDKKNQVALIKRLEESYKNNKSFIIMTDLPEAEEVEFVLNSPDLFFQASKSRIIMMHWLMREIRRIYERVSFVPIDMANEVYEALRKHFKTKAFNKKKLLSLFDLTTTTLVSYEVFSEIEDKYIDCYNDIVSNDMKLPKIKHIFVPAEKEVVDLRIELDNLLSKKRIEDVLYARANGETLEAIGQEYGITRERARQIEIKPKALIERWMDERSEELIKIFGGNILAEPKKALSYFNERQWAIIKYCTTGKEKKKFSKWHYIKNVDTICYSSSFEKDVFEILVKCANEGLPEKETAGLIKDKYNFLTDSVITKFYKGAGVYAYGGKMYATKVNIGKGIIAAVNDKFTDGIKISDEKQLKEFSDYLNEKFGLHTKPNRALTARIQDILVMSDKATYKSPAVVNTSDTLDNEIKKFMEKLEDDRAPYQLLFDSIPKEILAAYDITTYSGLHGYVKKNEKNLGVIALRYYICKGDAVNLKSKDFFEKFALWLKEKDRPCSTEEIIEAFDGWTNMYPKYAMLYFPQIVQWGNGAFFNLDCIKLSDSAIEAAKKALDEATKNKLKYTNSYVMYPKLRTNAPEFVSDDRIKTESHAYLLLKYKFADEKKYIFAKPHIVKASVVNSNNDYTTEDLIRNIIGKKNLISKPELVYESQRLYGSKNSSLCLATQNVLEDYCRVTIKDYYKKSAIRMTSADVEKLEKFVEKNMLKGEIMVPVRAEGYEGLPDMPFKWTSWAICSCIELFSTKYRVMFKKANIIQNNMVIVPVSAKYETREEIAAYIVNKNYKGQMDEESITLYLKTVGLYFQSVPYEEIKKGIKF